MKVITTSQFRNNFAACLKKIQQGETFIITKYGKPICEIRPRANSKLALFDSLTGIASGVNALETRKERLSRI